MDDTFVRAETTSLSRRDGRAALLLIAAATLVACSSADPLRPSPTDTTTTGVPPARPPFVEPTRAATIYLETTDLYDACSSRFVLFEDSTFQL